MSAKPPVIIVAARPAKPLLVYDGDCNFCKFWILRWRRFTRRHVDYAASQEAQIAERFPEIPRERFAESVQLIETDGRVYGAAEAVFKALAYERGGGALWWLYRNIPGCAPVAERIYFFVAKRRTGFSFLTRLLWGRDGALPEYRRSGWLFLRFLGVIYLCAFASLGTQVIGLIGKNGVLPAESLMSSAREQFDQANMGLERYHVLPTLCWFSTTDGFLRLLCVAGCGLSVLLIANVAPAPCLFLLWLIYLSLASVCREFLSFQWDALLLETGFLAIFLAPLQLWPEWLTALFRRKRILDNVRPHPGPLPQEREKSATAYVSKTPEPARVMRWLLWWLLFRLMFESGAVKLTSGDPTWRNLTALDYHYQTQPLPTWVAWYAHQLPEGFQKFCVVAMFGIELVVPFFIFLPRRVRIAGCWLLLLLQGVILLTGNYCFFNLLAIALCLLLLDDATLRKLVPAKWRKRSDHPPYESVALNELPTPHPNPMASQARHEIVSPKGLCASRNVVPVEGRGRETARPQMRWPAWVMLPLAALVLLITLPQAWETACGTPVQVRWWKKTERWFGSFSSLNEYGLFRVMTTARPEIIIEGSNDGKTWRAYGFKYKPGDPKRRPAFVAPHQPRLDWQMWFAALGDYRQNRWLVNLCIRLMQGSPEVLKLMGKNPFPDAPPRYIRAQLYDYRFSDPEERRKEGVWWERKYEGEYLPVISLQEK